MVKSRLKFTGMISVELREGKGKDIASPQIVSIISARSWTNEAGEWGMHMCMCACMCMCLCVRVCMHAHAHVWPQDLGSQKLLLEISSQPYIQRRFSIRQPAWILREVHESFPPGFAGVWELQNHSKNK